jgi:hypothetical protein
MNENIETEQSMVAIEPTDERKKARKAAPVVEREQELTVNPTDTQDEQRPAFEPGRYLMKIDGRDYLEVKWRLLWLRTEHPDAAIHTELVKHEDGFALFKADVFIPGGHGSATGWGSETIQDFTDYIEAAETKALGRALAALGYGTQFCRDFDFAAIASENAARAQVVDAPINFSQTTGFQRMNGNGHSNGYSNGSNGYTSVEAYSETGTAVEERPRITSLAGQLTDKQLKAIYAIARNQRRMSEPEVDQFCQETYGVEPANLSKAEASRFIDILKQQEQAA